MPKAVLRIRIDIQRIRIQLTENTDPDPNEILHSFDENETEFFLSFIW